MTPATRDNLTRLIARVDQLVADQAAEVGPRPDWFSSTFDERRAWDTADRAAWAKLEEILERNEAARIGQSTFGSHTLTMAGVRATCTSGMAGLLRNWQAAARRKLEKADA